MSQRRRKHLRPKPQRRMLRAENLEQRRLLAGDLGGSLHNASYPTDVNGDGRVSSIDALAVVNHITRLAKPEAESFLASDVGRSPQPPADPPPPDSSDPTVSAPTSPLPTMAAATASGASPTKMVDVDNNGIITAKDALMVINDLLLEGEIIPANTPLPDPLDYSLFPKAADVDDDGPVDLEFDVLTNFKTLDPTNPDFEYTSVFNRAFRTDGAFNQLAMAEVSTLLDRASAATTSDDAIIAVVDRNGTILGVRVEAGVSVSLTGPGNEKALAFAIDGAVAKARTAAFFSSNAAPLTSRTIRSLSQSTMVQRVVESSPVAITQEYVGPGFVAPIGVGGKFPPEVDFTPQVDLFAIEHQSRDSQRHPGPDQIKGNEDDFYLRTRFNGDPTFIPSNSETFFQTWPESYGVQTETFFDSQSRGVATLPGGVPLFKLTTDNDGADLLLAQGAPLSQSINLVGGIGVFFPGEDGYATFEQGFEHGVGQSERARTNAPKVLEAEFAAVIAAAGAGVFSPNAAFSRDVSGFNAQLPSLPNYILPNGRIDLVGITLEIFGPNPTPQFRIPGIDRLLQVGAQNFGGAGFVSGNLVPVDNGGALLKAGQPVPEGWLVAPHDSQVSGLTAEAVDQIIAQGVVEAQRTRAAIRLEIDNNFRPGARTGMVLAVADTTGELLGLYRMPDATIFSIDVSLAKARNMAYYADPVALQPQDRVDFNSDGVFGNVSTSLSDTSGDTLPLGTAFTNRTTRFLVEPRYPSGIELAPGSADGLVNDPSLNFCDQRPVLCLQVAPQSILRLPGINPVTGENLVDDAPLAASVYATDANTFSVLAFDAFNPSRNFRDPGDAEVIINGDGTAQPLANQNGIVFFPGSTPLYLDLNPNALIGGLGVSGDGVDQDDVVTSAGQVGFGPPASIRADQFPLAGVRLPFEKFNRNPFGP